MSPPHDILLLEQPIPPEELRRLVEAGFGDMLKYVVDLERRRLALGGELHVDAEALLLEEGSRQEDLWGGNYLPGRGEGECIEHTSMINIRPSLGNGSMLVESPELRERIRELVFALVGRGEPLP